ncbi:MAG: sugar ABC transporter permease [Anaerolineae bacterium]|nr:sugar ABC transporter permease [Anaerolineae bacterium]
MDAKTRKKVLIAIVAVIAVVYAVFPLYWMVIASFNPTQTLSTRDLLPRQISLKNYYDLFNDPNTPFLTWMKNSLIVSLTTAAISVTLTCMAAYPLSRLRFRGRSRLIKGIVLVQIFPNLLAIIAVYLIIIQIGNVLPFMGVNSRASLILVYLGSVLGGNVWLLKGYLDSIPFELDESAMIDGATNLQIFTRILLPLMRPMIAVVAILVFIGVYSEIVIARVLTQENESLTLAVGLWTLADSYSIGYGQYRWGMFAAGSLLAALPVVTLFFILQDWIIEGLTRGAIKT